MDGNEFRENRNGGKSEKREGEAAVAELRVQWRERVSDPLFFAVLVSTFWSDSHAAFLCLMLLVRDAGKTMFYLSPLVCPLFQIFSHLSGFLCRYICVRNNVLLRQDRARPDARREFFSN